MSKKEQLYFDILQDTLIKKNQLLDELIEFTKKQQRIILDNEFDEMKFSNMVEEKEKVLTQLQEYDDGFEVLYQSISVELVEHKYEYQNNIKSMQQLIKNITEKSILLKNLELQNKLQLEIYFKQERDKIRNFKMNNKAVTSYYKNMNQVQGEDSYFLDKKK